MFMRMVYLAWSLPKRYPISFAAILLAGAGSLDYLVGYNVRLSALYLLPLLLAGLTRNPAYGYGMAIACAWTEAVAKITATPDAVSNPVFFWNIAMNTALYLFIASLLASFKGHLLKEGDRKSPIDALTGLHNIVGFHELAAVELQRSRSHGRQMTLIYFDCHSFRDLNPAGGISDNDAFLIAISRILKTSLRVSDLLFRWRENEFLFLLPETDQSAAMAVANYLRPTIKARGLEQGWIVTFSIGVAVYERLPADIDEMLTKAEQVMAEARRSSQNSIGFRIF